MGLPRLPSFDSTARRWFWVVLAAVMLPYFASLSALDFWDIPAPLFAALAAVLVMTPAATLILALIARLRPQDFTFSCLVCDLANVGAIRLPKTMQQALWGSRTCRGCGSELDRRGNLTR